MKKFLVIVITVMLAGFISCTKNVEKKEGLAGDLKIAGGTAHIQIMKTVAEILMKENPELNISISGGGSGLGIKQVGEGLVDIGNSGRDLKDSEINEFGLIPHKIAIDGIAIVVHPSASVEELSFSQIQNVFSGKIKNWNEIGGADLAINIYTRDAKSGTRKIFEKLAMGEAKITDIANFVTSNGNMKVLVAGDEGAIGYMSAGYLDDTIKPLAVEGVVPTLENIRNKSYKIQRYLYSVTKGEAKGIVKVLLDRVLSEEGQNVVAKKGFIKVK
ncbi:MAG: phosphate ABC transporter substrate-binding protein [Candidatus Delongbacteria bacterium]|jgi:phosphate transport system substrate-binding protein|nr:phosphate ABC transporter substrate-binding protein [Candidatus Delongbacteria bacterium]